MKRRNLLRGAVLAPAAVAVAAPAPAAAQYAAPVSDTAAKVAVNMPSFVGAQRASFFDELETKALRALAGVLVPAYNGMPGAVECGVVEFFDFLVSQAPEVKQQLWRTGLHELDARSLQSHGARFEKLNAAQANAVLEPLKVKWTFYGPQEPFAKFLWEARGEMVQATLNSREYAEANTGRRSAAASNYYWRSLD
jgi:hypothetical protein